MKDETIHETLARQGIPAQCIPADETEDRPARHTLKQTDGKVFTYSDRQARRIAWSLTLWFVFYSIYRVTKSTWSSRYQDKFWNICGEVQSKGEESK